VEWRAGRERGEQPREQLALFALLEASVCFSSNVHWIYIGDRPLRASGLPARPGPRNRQAAASFPSSSLLSSARGLFHTLAQQDLLIRYDKQHSCARLAGCQLTFQEHGRVLPLCERTLIKL